MFNPLETPILIDYSSINRNRNTPKNPNHSKDLQSILTYLINHRKFSIHLERGINDSASQIIETIKTTNVVGLDRFFIIGSNEFICGLMNANNPNLMVIHNSTTKLIAPQFMIDTKYYFMSSGLVGDNVLIFRGKLVLNENREYLGEVEKFNGNSIQEIYKHSKGDYIFDLNNIENLLIEKGILMKGAFLLNY